MTYWNEVSGDQKDAWYWMEVAMSMACRFNLHRDPSNFGMEPNIDVPLLTVKEVDISPIANHLSIIPQASKMRTIDWQKNLAENCIAEFGLRISNEGSIMSFSKLFTFEELNSMFRHKIHETGMANLSTSTPSTQDIIGQWTILDSSPNKAPLRQSVDLSHDMEHTNVWSDDSLRNCLGWSDLQNDVGFSW
ncbi:hypothetical protein B0O99DRAFT_634428 [Bisporella sp. PMI_857]|nr:hypothetical protein B0O99DRAFT_634428 [Bisporella sp. PMI_857]